MSLFTKQEIGILGQHKSNNGGPIAELFMGDGVKLYFPMIEVSTGVQTDRIQVDVALDGSLHVSGGVNNGVGSYQLLLLDGPLLSTEKLFGEKPTSKSTAAQQYLAAKTLHDRKIRVKLFTSESWCGSTKKVSSNPIATFSGIANTIRITLSEERDTVLIKTQIDAVGSWERQEQ